MNRRDFFKLGFGGTGFVVGGGLVSGLDTAASSSHLNKGGHPWWVETTLSPKLVIDDKVY